MSGQRIKVVPNEADNVEPEAAAAIKHMRIEKPLEKLEEADYWKWSEGPNGDGKDH